MIKNNYNIFCSSNASKDIYKNNTLSSFKNLLPQSLQLTNRQWEIGITSFGFQLNSKILTNSLKQPAIIVLNNKKNNQKANIKNENISIVWNMPSVNDLTIEKMMESIGDFFKNKCRFMFNKLVISDNVDKEYIYEIKTNKTMTETILIHEDLVKLLKFQNFSQEIFNNNLQKTVIDVHENIIKLAKIKNFSQNIFNNNSQKNLINENLKIQFLEEKYFYMQINKKNYNWYS